VPRLSIRFQTLAATCFAVALLTCVLAAPLSAQEKRAPQTAGVDNTKMGPYRALAQLAYAASQKEITPALQPWRKSSSARGTSRRLWRRHRSLKDQSRAIRADDKAMDSSSRYSWTTPRPVPIPPNSSRLFPYLEKLKLAD